MISILMPTRNRPKEMKRAIDSARSTAINSVEIVLYLDDDSDTVEIPTGVRYIIGPRIVLSDCWNECAKVARGDILMMFGDDGVFKTNHWDEIIEQAFAQCPDKILMVHGDDGMPQNSNFGVFPTIHRRWVDTVGYFVPPVFTGDYPDTWLNDVANSIGRRKRLPYVTEHLHPVWGKAPLDKTYQEKWDRDKALNPAQLYASLAMGRKRDADLLRAVMK
jgi:glycosyltransferase involved in cell wall biosynthesis